MILSLDSTYSNTGEVVEAGSIVNQTRQVMGQVQQLLGQFGAGFDDVVKINRWYAEIRASRF